MKKKLLVWVALISMVTLYACDEVLTVEEAAAKASDEMCDCIKNKSESDCEKDLNSHFSSYVNNDDFYTAFNKVNNCGIQIYKKTD